MHASGLHGRSVRIANGASAPTMKRGRLEGLMMSATPPRKLASVCSLYFPSIAFFANSTVGHP